MEAKPTPAVDKELVLKVAKNLQGGYSKQTAGEPRKWKDVPADEKVVWMRLARTAAKLLMPEAEPTLSG